MKQYIASGTSQTTLSPAHVQMRDAGSATDQNASLRVPTRAAIEHFSRRRNFLMKLRGFAIGLVVLFTGMLLLVIVDQFFRLETPMRLLASFAVDAIAVGAAWKLGIRASRNHDSKAIARSMESAAPDLHERMVSAVELNDPQSANGSFAFRAELQDSVASQVTRLQVPQLLPWSLIKRPVFAAISIVAAIGLLSLIPSWQIPRRLARVMLPMVPIERASLTKIRILYPNPASQSVAEGDLVAVNVAVENLDNQSVTLEWMTENRNVKTLIMSPRSLVNSPTPSDEHQQTFAVNLPVHQSPVLYRILASDAETLWHRLTPRPRPKMVAFEKRYQFPEYSKLPDATIEEPDGDLTGLAGTVAEVIVKFDQPVQSVELLFGGRANDTRIPIERVESSDNQFQFRIPIKTPGSYRIDGVSVDSNLNNPFSPRFSIDPVIDQDPTANWAADTDERRIVSSVAVFNLNGRVEDDLPMDHAIWQTVLNDGPVKETAIEITASRSSPVSIDWDMLRDRGNVETPPLPPGSQLKTRLIAIDRTGNRGASEWIHVFIGGADYDPSRHAPLRQYQQLTQRTHSLLNDLAQLSREIHESTDQKRNDAEAANMPTHAPTWRRRILDLSSQWDELSDVDQRQASQSESPDATVASWLSKSNDSVEAERWVMIDRYVSLSITGIRDQLKLVSQTFQDTEGSEATLDDHVIRTLDKNVVHTAKGSDRVGELVQWMLSVELAAGLMQDLLSIESDCEVIAKSESTIPIERLPGQAELLIERLNQVGSLAHGMKPDLPPNLVRHQENWQRHLGELTTRIAQANEKLQLDQDPDVERHFRDTMREITVGIRSQLVTGLFHGDPFQQVASRARELNGQEYQAHFSIHSLGQIHNSWDKANNEHHNTDKQLDTARLQRSAFADSLNRTQYDDAKKTVLARYQHDETVERLRRDTIVEAASDWKLIRAALEVITGNTFPNPPNKSHSISDALNVVTKAASTLESGHQVFRLMRQLQDAADRERYGDNFPDAAIRQRTRLEHYQVMSETPLLLLREGGVNADAIQELQNARWDKDFQQARQRMTARNGDARPLIAATDPVESLVLRHQQHSQVIEVAMQEARIRLRQFLPTTGELARSASKEASKKTEDASKEAQSEQSKLKLDKLESRVDALVENLADRANTTDYRDDTQRELAKDADATIGKIGELMDAITNHSSPTNPTDLATSTEQSNDRQKLAEVLKTTAEHFDAADAGQPLESTRQALRHNAPSTETRDAARSAEATSDAANATPAELLKRLEKRLERDEAMQTELAEISKQTASSAEEAIRSIAQQEQKLRQDLEKADANFLEKKRELRNQLRSLSEQARAVTDHWLGMTEQASGWKQDWATQETTRQVSRQIREAIDKSNQVQNDEAMLSELEATAGELEKSLAEAESALRPIQETAEKKSSEEKHNSEKSRQQKARQLESAQRQVQNRWLQSLTQRAKDWKHRADEINRRVQQNTKEQRNAQKQLDQAEQHLKKHPEAGWAEQGVRESRRRLDESSTATEQSKRTRQAAENAALAASKRLDQQRKNSVKDLQANDPSSELLARVTEKSRQELARLSEDLKQLANQSDLAKSLSPSPKKSENIASQQTLANETVRRTSEDLRRASRHEERLGNDQAATQLAEAADQLSEIADNPMKQATASLDEVTAQDDPEDSARLSVSAQAASERLGQAAEQLRRSADRIAAIQSSRTEQPSESSDSDQKDSTGTVSEANRSEKLARTLDELDRGLQSTGPSDNENQDLEQTSDQSSSELSSESNSRDSNQGESKEGRSNQGNPTAGQTSPTLAAAAQQAIRELAAQRQKQVQQIAESGQEGAQPNSSKQSQPNSSKSSGQDSDNNPFGELGQSGNQSGDGQSMPHDESLDAESQIRLDGDWGALRERRNDDGIQDRKAALPPSYRPAIEAYFKAISAEASRSDSSTVRQKQP